MAEADYTLQDVMDTFKLDGSSTRAKARVLLDGPWVEAIYPHIRNPETPVSSLLAIGEKLIELGDMKPKPVAATAQGAAFSITINVPQPDGQPPIVIEGKAREPIPDAPMTYDTLEIEDEVDILSSADALDEKVAFTVPDFSLLPEPPPLPLRRS